MAVSTVNSLGVKCQQLSIGGMTSSVNNVDVMSLVVVMPIDNTVRTQEMSHVTVVTVNLNIHLKHLSQVFCCQVSPVVIIYHVTHV